MIDVVTRIVTPFQQNARVIGCKKTGEAVIVDPGGDVERLIAEVEGRGWKLTAVWLTHSHLDHCGGVAALLKLSSCPVLAHADGAELRSTVVEQAKIFGAEGCGLENCPEPDRLLSEGDQISVGDISFMVYHIPGHSPDGLCFYTAQEALVLTGDVLFSRSIGRSDLPGSDGRRLLKGIHSKLLTLPRETRVLAGHGPDTTIGAEAKYNPFLQGERHG